MTELSPAEQVMIAVTHVYQEHGGDPPARAITAAALRAVADTKAEVVIYDCFLRTIVDVDDIYAIADELETQQSDHPGGLPANSSPHHSQ